MPFQNELTSLSRINFLDGLRGWASFVVLLNHILLCFLMVSMQIPNYGMSELVEDVSNHNLFSILIKIIFRVIFKIIYF